MWTRLPRSTLWIRSGSADRLDDCARSNATPQCSGTPQGQHKTKTLVGFVGTMYHGIGTMYHGIGTMYQHLADDADSSCMKW
eukprot:20102-Chlamydomonas_euryale.AAC.1